MRFPPGIRHRLALLLVFSSMNDLFSLGCARPRSRRLRRMRPTRVGGARICSMAVRNKFLVLIWLKMPLFVDRKQPNLAKMIPDTIPTRQRATCSRLKAFCEQMSKRLESQEKGVFQQNQYCHSPAERVRRYPGQHVASPADASWITTSITRRSRFECSGSSAMRPSILPGWRGAPRFTKFPRQIWQPARGSLRLRVHPAGARGRRLVPHPVSSATSAVLRGKFDAGAALTVIPDRPLPQQAVRPEPSTGHAATAPSPNDQPITSGSVLRATNCR